MLLYFYYSGPCMTLAITKPGDDIGEDLLPEFRSLIGPLDVNTAKEEAPSRWVPYSENSVIWLKWVFYLNKSSKKILVINDTSQTKTVKKQWMMCLQ